MTDRPTPNWRPTPDDPLLPPQNKQKAEIEKVWVSDGKQNGESGALVHVVFNTANLEGNLCGIAAFFHDQQDKPIKSSIPEYSINHIPEYSTNPTTLHVEDNFTPSKDFVRYDNYTLFIPDKAFNILLSNYPGNNVINLKFIVSIYRIISEREEDVHLCLTRTKWIPFHIHVE